MAKIVCIKCGVRGLSKCPHCRSSFMDRNPDLVVQEALEFVESRIKVQGDRQIGEDGKQKYTISFWTYATTNDEAMERMLRMLRNNLPDIPGRLLKVAGCDHEWHFLPGEESSIGCGHTEDQEYHIPEDPFQGV